VKLDCAHRLLVCPEKSNRVTFQVECVGKFAFHNLAFDGEVMRGRVELMLLRGFLCAKRHS
jgi:hypothetical protein